jgi:hypothetical protein
LPLASDDKDIPLDLQQVFTKCWNSGPYPELLHYEEQPPGELTDEEILFCREIVATK